MTRVSPIRRFVKMIIQLKLKKRLIVRSWRIKTESKLLLAI